MLSGPYRAGPWPGLTLRGALALVGCAALLAVLVAIAAVRVVALDSNPLNGGVLIYLLRAPTGVWPDIVALAIAAAAPLVLATVVVRAPGCASAVVGAYLLPRTLWSLVDPSVPLPPLVLVAAVAFDLAAWLRRSDVRVPWRKTPWRMRDRTPRQLTIRRLALATAVFVATTIAVEPAWRSYLER